MGGRFALSIADAAGVGRFVWSIAAVAAGGGETSSGWAIRIEYCYWKGRRRAGDPR